MKVYQVVLALIFLILTSHFSYGNDLEGLYKKGSYYFKTSRYHNAEVTLNQLVKSLKNKGKTDQAIYFYTIELLALSRSEQGKINGVSTLLEEKVAIAERQFGSDSFQVANSLMTLAEAIYREGKRKQSLELLTKSETIYKEISPKPNKRLHFLQKNREEYLRGPFNKNKLPFDLSNFYTVCESISISSKTALAKNKMKPFVEVGVDYEPEGVWKEIFSSTTLTGVENIPGYDKKIIYIPKNIDSLKDEWCVIYIKNDVIVAAITHQG